jgi:hypothetical protein
VCHIYLICRNQRAKPIIIDPGLYLSKKSDLSLTTQRRSLPTSFKLFTGRYNIYNFSVHWARQFWNSFYALVINRQWIYYFTHFASLFANKLILIGKLNLVLPQVKSAYYNVFDKGFFYLFIFIGGGVEDSTLYFLFKNLTL